MDVERETLVEAGVSVAVVGLFVLVLIGIGLTYGGEGGDLGEAGALALIGSIAAFIVVMGAVGYLLNRRLDDEAE
jgi:hypothetical protein